MFTGIVQGTAKLVAIDKKAQFQTHVIDLPEPLSSGLAVGASVAHNGCCLTVTHINGHQVSFDLMQETLRLTNLGQLNVGDAVNIERAAKFGDEIGGHSMSGHIICMATVVDIIDSAHNKTLWFEIPESLMKYVLPKGYIGLDGCSLTIGQVEANRFNVHLIPETLQRTLFGSRKIGDKINVEIDPQTQAIVDTVERVLAKQS
ncbi:riboflavin synthase subunit alpha [Vibrio injensis]|uniref:riboflavin synthase subunit alpha n=1 Tax=Vibrio injensis TaxID=1307414 RepID=UPI00278C7CEE|nr:riboflavin synthase subunit alpha [Vibrio injensis]EKO3735249.1 riboflavin synthase subunit alpha [Vibrio metschnikovii]EKO3746586.1 riboflavin synthase subunit alpha [Vibrio metschnikovii]EKO3926575.1 riboflavin synthase subunit alpha [Vibrio metschnikovii]